MSYKYNLYFAADVPTVPESSTICLVLAVPTLVPPGEVEEKFPPDTPFSGASYKSTTPLPTVRSPPSTSHAPQTSSTMT